MRVFKDQNMDFFNSPSDHVREHLKIQYFIAVGVRHAVVAHGAVRDSDLCSPSILSFCVPEC